MTDVDVRPLAEVTPAPGAWAADAACAAFPESFSPDSEPDPDELVVAARICRRCPVREQCGEYAAQWAMWGLWAGRWYDATQRRHNAA